MLSSDLVKLRRIVDKITKGFVEGEDGSLQPVQDTKADPKALVEVHIDDVCYRVGTKPLTNLVVVQHEDNNNLLDESDFFGKTAVIGTACNNPLSEFLAIATKLDQYEYFLYLPKDLPLSIYFYSNLSNWRPLLRYQVKVGSPVVCLDSKAIITPGHDYVLSNYMSEVYNQPILIHQSAVRDIAASTSINDYLKNKGLNCFYSNQDLLSGSYKLEWTQELGPLVYPDGVPNTGNRRRHEQLFSICKGLNSVSYYGTSTSDIVTLAQACKLVSVLAPAMYIDKLNMVIWLDRFGLRHRVRFYSGIDASLPNSEVCLFADWSKPISANHLLNCYKALFICSPNALALATKLGFSSSLDVGSIKVLSNEAR